MTLVSAPSNSRMLSTTRVAMNSSTACGTSSGAKAAFLRRIARRVSTSGGWMSVVSPHSNLLRMRSSRLLRLFGGRSAEKISCLPASYSELKVWKNSSRICSLPSRNWTSSRRSMSTRGNEP